jgi:uncharacterized protein with HEPN domain
MDRDRAYLLDILSAARLALSYVEGVAKDAFLADTQRQDSVIRRIEIIGEAARRVSPQTQAAHPGIPWNEMIGMRNQMIHDYDDVDLEIGGPLRDLPRLIS